MFSVISPLRSQLDSIRELQPMVTQIIMVKFNGPHRATTQNQQKGRECGKGLVRKEKGRGRREGLIRLHAIHV